MERQNPQQCDSSIHCQDLIDYADDQRSTNVCNTTVCSPVENPAIVYSLATVESFTNIHSLNNIDSSTTVCSAEFQTIVLSLNNDDGSTSAFSPATIDCDSVTSADPSKIVDNPTTVNTLSVMVQALLIRWSLMMIAQPLLIP